MVGLLVDTYCVALLVFAFAGGFVCIVCGFVCFGCEIRVCLHYVFIGGLGGCMVALIFRLFYCCYYFVIIGCWVDWVLFA